MTHDELKASVGQAALAYVVPGSVVGVGTGSTVNCFIDALAGIRDRIAGAVSSSEKSSERLRKHGIRVLDGFLDLRDDDIRKIRAAFVDGLDLEAGHGEELGEIVDAFRQLDVFAQPVERDFHRNCERKRWSLSMK